MGEREQKEDEKAIERYVPSEMIREILYQLPCKSLVRLSSTCKLWHSLATDRHFISSHQRRTESNPSNFLSFDINSKEVHLFHLDIDSVNHVRSIVLPLDGRCDTVLRSSYGLACVYSTYDKKMIVFNPITQQIVNLARVPCFYNPQNHLMGFGFHPHIKKYKAVVLSLARIRDGIIITGHVVTLHPSGRSMIWRPVIHSMSGAQDYAHPQVGDVLTVAHKIAVCADGVLYWGPHVLKHEFNIVSFDLQTKQLQWVTGPKRSGNLINLQEKLCSVEELHYGNGIKWTMRIWMLRDSIRGEWMPFHTLNFGPEVRSMFPLCIQHGKVILWQGHDNILYSYDIEEKSFRVLKGKQPYGVICAHAETLVSIIS